MSNLAKVFPGKPIEKMTLSEFLDNFNCMQDIVQVAYEQFHNIEQQLDAIDNLHSIKPLLDKGYEELSILIGQEQYQYITQNVNFGGIVKDAFIKLKNFFIKLWDMIVAFFKRMFDTNIRSRHTMNSSITEFYRNRSKISDERIKVLSVFMIDKVQFDKIHEALLALADDTVNASKAESSDVAAQYTNGLTQLGYIIQNGVIVETTSTKKIKPNSKRFDASGWTVDTFIEATQNVSALCSRSEQANYIKNRLDNELKAGMREVDRLNSMEKPEEAIALQTRLNDLSKRSSFVFKCAVTLQSYVEHLSIQFTDTWNNINNLTY